ncbi:hypothetical protein VTL71DRAFT_14928 [Oculimacula yallundae]|uniref:Zn(2)-C6 fungal-type domain-containing protein n=1 Tax=Oculimacula yallundae TaxID=86028 RepID=A0ABR4CF56_9HELO
MSSTDLVKKPQATRQSHPKVRSGCLTCKLRKVKCDEGRPSCKRCRLFGVRCDGYPPPKKDAKAMQRPKAILLPKFQSSQAPLSLASPSLTSFQSEDESRYFEIFGKSTAYDIFPNVEMGRLRLMFLQACEARDAIRHAVIALGALDMTSRTRSHYQTRDAARCDYGESASCHYQRAIQQYAKALKCAQLEGGTDLRTTLMTSLIILAFEGWIGNHRVAVEQIRIGTELLAARKEQQELSPISNEDDAILARVFTRLSILLKAPGNDRPSPPSTPALLPPLKIELPESLQNMPAAFSSLGEANFFYGLIVQFAVVFVSQGLARIARPGTLLGTIPRTYIASVVVDTIPPEVTKAQIILTNCLHSWMAAFIPLKTSIEFAQVEQKKACITLELQMKAIYMGTIKSLAYDEMAFDAYYDIYKDMIDLCEALLNCSGASRVPKFCFDSGVIIPLWLTGHKCRDPALRARVIALLLGFPRREGVWDSVFAGLVVEVVRGFEEEFLEGGMVPGWARIRNTSFEIDAGKRSVEIQCQQRKSAVSDEIVVRRKIVDYYVYTGIALEQMGAVIAQDRS